MARARGSYPRCRGFDSPSRYYISESSSLCELLFLLFISYYLSQWRKESHQSRRILSVEKNSTSAGGDQKQSIPGGSTISELKKAMNSLNTSYRYIKEFMAYLNLSGII